MRRDGQDEYGDQVPRGEPTPNEIEAMLVVIRATCPPNEFSKRIGDRAEK